MTVRIYYSTQALEILGKRKEEFEKALLDLAKVMEAKYIYVGKYMTGVKIELLWLFP